MVGMMTVSIHFPTIRDLVEFPTINYHQLSISMCPVWNQVRALFASCHWKEPQRKRKREREEGGEDGEVDGADINLTLAEAGWGTGSQPGSGHGENSKIPD